MTTLRDGEVESAAEMSAALQTGDVTATELAERAVARAQAWQPSINAFSQLWPEEALDAARRIDAMPPPQRPGPLSGVPIAIKDLFDVAGHDTTGCCAAYRGNLAGGDATLIERIRAGGLVMIGKTNQHELAAGGTNKASACGRPCNPWDRSRITGGSSGGSGAAVAAGIVPWALGSDTGGSIRIPASLCGTFGLKPTTGRLPLDGVMPLAPSMDCPGPLAQTTADVRWLYAVMSGDEPAAGGTPRYRIAVLAGFFEEVLHRDVQNAVQATASLLETFGVEAEEVGGRGIEEARRVWMDVCTPEFAQAHPKLREPDRRRLVAPQVVDWLEWGERVTPAEREAAGKAHEDIRRWYLERLEGKDAVLIPTTPYPAPGADQSEVDLGGGRTADVDTVGPGYITCSVNLAGLPAINIPAGRSSDGLPIGVSLVAHTDAERVLFDLAALWEEGTAYRPARPAMPNS
jgi:aspartyl-tRNA(Asn)/glutamyl-tRNA(Gln) amidotransferase subunit A